MPLPLRGANVCLSGRNIESLVIVAKEIIAAGGHAETAIVNALDEKGIKDYTEQYEKF